MHKHIIVFIIVLTVSALISHTDAKSHAERRKEIELKAAYIYNFIKFTDWPKDTFKDEKEPLIIGVFDEDQQENLSKVLREKSKNNHPIQVLHLKKQDIQSKENVQRCQILFFPKTFKNSDEQSVFKHIQNHPVLTIGERNKFLEAGGMINFVLEKKKIRFEINLIAVEKAGLKIRAKLLKLAKRVIRKEMVCINLLLKISEFQF